MARFVPGRSGNPAGRPRADPELREACRAHTKRAIETLAKCLDSDDPRVAIAAAIAILDRGYGRPAQAITGADGDNEIRVVIRDLAAERLLEKGTGAPGGRRLVHHFGSAVLHLVHYARVAL